MIAENDGGARDIESARRAAELRRSVNAARVRLDEQRRQLERARVELAALRALAQRARTPDAMEAVRDSARVLATSLGSGALRLARNVLPYAALAAFAVAYDGLGSAPRPAAKAPSVSDAARAPAARPPLPPLAAAPAPAAEADEGEQEALLLADEWRSPIDGRALAQRAGVALDLPGAPPRWSVERTGESTYRVGLRADGGARYELDVDLSAGRAAPTPETEELLAPASALASRL